MMVLLNGFEELLNARICRRRRVADAGVPPFATRPVTFYRDPSGTCIEPFARARPAESPRW
jgi:hypothetical protein